MLPANTEGHEKKKSECCKLVIRSVKEMLLRIPCSAFYLCPEEDSAGSFHLYPSIQYHQYPLSSITGTQFFYCVLG